MFPIVCFQPSYFPKSYVPPSAEDSGDLEAFAAVAARLAATGEFAAVLLGPPSTLDALPAERSPAAIISPTEWVERVGSDLNAAVRDVSFELTLAVRCDDADTRYCLLERLSTVAQGALERANLGGTCLPELTRIGRGRHALATRDTEGRAVLSGEFGYRILDRTHRNP